MCAIRLAAGTRAEVCYAQPLAADFGRLREADMAKGQVKKNKETKKPKADKSAQKGSVSAYQQSQGKGGPAANPFAKKG